MLEHGAIHTIQCTHGHGNTEYLHYSAVDGDLRDAHPGHEAPVPPHPKDALLGLIFVTWCIILLEVAIRGWAHGGYKGIDIVRYNAQVGCSI